MAMVFLTDRKLDNNQKQHNIKDTNLTLIPKSEEKKITLKAKPPFNIQGIGHQDFSILNDNPGPGTYNLEVDFIKPQINSNLNLHFLTKCPRFINNNNEREDSPGPGSYNLSDKPLLKKRLFNRPNSNFDKYNINSYSYIPSIPTKKQSMGYLENEEGELIQTISPPCEKYLNNNNGDKNYTINQDKNVMHSKGKNPIVKWNRMSAKNISLIKRDKSLINNINNMSINANKNSSKNESIGDMSKISKLETDISFIKNSKEKKKYEHRMIKMKDLMNDYKKKLNLSRFTVSKKEEIEPLDIERELEFLNYAENHKNNLKGLLYPINFNLIRYQSKPEKYQFFGSSVERGINKLPMTDRLLNPGPGTYFHDTLKNFKIKDKNKNKIKSTFSKSKRLEMILNKSSSIGPGSYNIENNDSYNKKKSFNKCGSFSCEKRFSNMLNDNSYSLNKKYIFPGPGDYDTVDLWKKNLKNEFYKQTFVNAEKEIKKRINQKLKEKKPDFNEYQNPGFINLIQTKVYSKINPYTSENTPFMSRSGRFTNIKECENNTNIGPGSYEVRQNLGNLYQNNINNAPFNSNQEKNICFSNNSNSSVSPLEYQKDSYFDWNKKSFNVMFV